MARARLLALGLVLGVLVVATPLAAQMVTGLITGGAGGGGGGGVSASLVCLLTGGSDCTMTGGVVFDGVTDDLTTSTDEDLTIASAGTGLLVSERDITVDSLPGFIVGGTKLRQDGTGGGVLINSYGFHATGAFDRASSGMTPDRGATQLSWCAADNYQTGVSIDDLQCFYGEGLRAVARRQAITIADDGAGTSPTDTTAIGSEHVELDCMDADGCSWAPPDSGPEGAVSCAVAISSATVTVSDSAGVIAVPGSSVVLEANDVLCLLRTAGGVWVTSSLADN